MLEIQLSMTFINRLVLKIKYFTCEQTSAMRTALYGTTLFIIFSYEDMLRKTIDENSEKGIY